MILSARFRIAILICMLLCACGEKNEIPESPFAIAHDSLILPDKMILILSDVHLVEASLLLERNQGKESKNKSDYYYQGVFRKYHISPARYDQNLTYYRQNPENYAKMYDKVIGILESRQKKISGKK